MKSGILRYLVVGVVFFLIGLVHYLPASIAAGWVANATPIKFDGVTGTVFDGKAAYASLPSGGVENLAWQIHPASLLLARVSADITADTDLGHASAEITRTLLGYNYVHAIRGKATLGWLAQLGGYSFVPASGRVAAHISQLDFNDDFDISALDGQIDLTKTRYELLNPPVDLGQFKVQLSRLDNGQLRAAIVNSQGPIAITGHADLVNKIHYVLDTRLRTRAGADDRLKPLMTQLGKPDNQGWYAIREQGRL